MSAEFEKAVRSSFHDLGWSEDFVQNLIANDPAVLGLGDLKLQERERRQPSGGRLDLLLQSIDDQTRYAVEVQVTPTDPSHIIRTIEYWDVERRRFKARQVATWKRRLPKRQWSLLKLLSPQLRMSLLKYNQSTTKVMFS